MREPTTLMLSEIGETPAAVARCLDREGAAIERLGQFLRDRDPPVVVTCARGSSDNAAAFFKYLAEIRLGTPVSSIGPSVASLYGAPLRLEGAVVVSVSQSGQSPDIVALQAAAKRGGALAIAVVNETASPLAAEADHVIPLHAGPERSVAATKSCIAAAAALAALVAAWRGDETLRAATKRLPDALGTTLGFDWGAALEPLAGSQSAYAVGRGPAFPVAAEAALKLKETAVLHAEAFSGAEVMHGPLQLLHDGFPVLAFQQQDASHSAMASSIERLRAARGRVFRIAADAPHGSDDLLVSPTGEPLLDPLAMLLGFYRLAEAVAVKRGHDPDRPSLLRKVTETI